ncbi:MAG TPA: response regulator [bacterium]|nr:response regulator [bacterium]
MEQAPGCKGRVLLIAKSIREHGCLREAIESAGYDVSAVRDGKEGVRQYFATNPDVVLLDLDIADMNGADVCRAISKDGAMAAPIIVLSPKIDLSEKLAMFMAGAKRFLQKPVDTEDLLVEVGCIAPGPAFNANP